MAKLRSVHRASKKSQQRFPRGGPRPGAAPRKPSSMPSGNTLFNQYLINDTIGDGESLSLPSSASSSMTKA